MSFVDDFDRSMLQNALGCASDIVGERAAAVTGSVAFIEGGRIVRQRPDGSRVDLGASALRTVRLAHRVGRLR